MRPQTIETALAMPQPFTWDYPVYAIAVDAGVVTVPGAFRAGEAAIALPIFTEPGLAREFIAGRPGNYVLHAVRDAHEFFRLVRQLADPVSMVAFDLRRHTGDRFTAAWATDLLTLVEEHLHFFFTWDYPVFVVRVGQGLACVDVAVSNGNEVTALAVFTDQDLAERYMSTAGLRGQIEPVRSAKQFSELLGDPEMNMVVFDLGSPEYGVKSRNCISKDELLTKWLL